MSAAAKFNITILFDHELRAAASALRALRAVDRTDDVAFSDAINAFVSATSAALWNIVLDAGEENPITVVSVPKARVTLVTPAPGAEKGKSE